MPTRYIKESKCTSKEIDKLSYQAEVLFDRLITKADDFGRFEAEPALLISNCFPYRTSGVRCITHEEIESWFAELCAAPLTIAYHEKGKRYGVFIEWKEHQTCRALKSKYPNPTSVNICQHLSSSPALLESAPITITKTKTKTNASTSARRFEQFWAAFPKKKSKGDAEKAWASLNPDESLQDTIMASLERAKTSEQWAKDRGQFIPHPATWLRRKGWEDEVKSNYAPTPKPRAIPPRPVLEDSERGERGPEVLAMIEKLTGKKSMTAGSA